MEPTDLNNEVQIWLFSMVGEMIDVVILQKSKAKRAEQVLWKGQGKVLRCVQEGVVLNLNAMGASWWSKLWGTWSVTRVVSRWVQKPISVPYGDLSIDMNHVTGTKQLVIDAKTWKRSPEELKGMRMKEIS